MPGCCCGDSSEEDEARAARDSEYSEQITLLKYGERLQYDQKFKGPLSKRSCTDVFCLLIFVIFLGAWGYIGNYAIKNGDLNKLLVPTDSFNRKCGVDASVKDKPNLFFFNLEKCIDPLVPITGCPTPQVCVSECPSETFVWDKDKNRLNLDDLKKKLICQREEYKSAINSLSDAEKAIQSNRCARWYVKSKPFGKRCVWDFASDKCEYIPLYMKDVSAQNLIMKPRTSSLVALPTTELSKLDTEVFVKKSNNNQLTSQRNTEAKEEIIGCEERYKLGEVYKEKLEKSNSYSKYASYLTGNLLRHFYNGEHVQEVGEKIVQDIVISWPTIFLALVVTMVVSLIFIALMRYVATPLVWLSILGVLVGLGFGVYLSIAQYKYWKSTSAVPNHSLNLSSTVKNIFQDPKIWLYTSIILAIMFVVIFLLVIVLRSRIRIAVALVKEGSKAVSCVFATVFFPILPWILFMCTITISVLIGLFLASVGEPSFIVTRSGESTEQCSCEGIAINYTRGAQCDPEIFQNHCSVKSSGFFSGLNSPCIETGCFFEGIANPKIVSYFQAYNFIGFLWLSFFISALGEMVLAATFATWYWTFHKTDVPYFVLTKAFGRTVRYHLGTIALGAFILTICRLIRVILEYIDQKLKKFDNSVTRAILCCMKCFFWCLENFLRFINKNAYIMCAIHGKNFCSSAKDSFNLLMRNFLRVIAVDKVTDFLFFLSKLLLTGAAGVGTYYYLQDTPNDPPLNYNAVPITIVVIATYLITSVFFGVYSMAVDTLFLCFLEDCERNDGSEEKPYFMSKQLMKILHKRNKMPTP